MECGESPYVVSNLAGKGRALLASRDLDPMELVLRDSPAASGPDETATEPVCVVCCDLMTEDVDVGCDRCGLALLCSQECATDSSHADFECKLLSERELKITIPLKFSWSLLPLRLLLLRDRDPELFNELWRLMDHNRERREREPDVWQHYQKNVVDYLLEDLGLSDKFTREDVNRSIGIIRTNGIETKNVLNQRKVGQQKANKARSLFPKVSLLSHSCVCNARCVQLEDHGIEIRTQVPIAKGEEITISYTSLLSGNRKRRKLLKKNWCFECNCERCSDRSELGTHLDSLVCRECYRKSDGGNLVLVANCDSDEESVQCSGCERRMTTKELEMAEDAFERELEGATTVEKMEQLLDKSSKEYGLHPTHALVMRLKSLLIASLGCTSGHLYHQMTAEQVARKVQLCKEFIAVFSKIDPGCTDWRGSTLFELAQACATLAQRRFDAGEYDVAKFRTELNHIIGLYQEASTLLEVEADGTHARDLAFRARRQMSDIRDLVRFAEFLH